MVSLQVGTNVHKVQFGAITKTGSSYDVDRQTSNDLHAIFEFAFPASHLKSYEIDGSVEGPDGKPLNYRMQNYGPDDMYIHIQDPERPEVESRFYLTDIDDKHCLFQPMIDTFVAGVRQPRSNKAEITQEQCDAIAYIAEAGRKAIQNYNLAKTDLLKLLRYRDPSTNHLSAVCSPKDPTIRPEAAKK